MAGFERTVRYLVAIQNDDGSWGTHRSADQQRSPRVLCAALLPPPSHAHHTTSVVGSCTGGVIVGCWCGRTLLSWWVEAAKSAGKPADPTVQAAIDKYLGFLCASLLNSTLPALLFCAASAASDHGGCANGRQVGGQGEAVRGGLRRGWLQSQGAAPHDKLRRPRRRRHSEVRHHLLRAGMLPNPPVQMNSLFSQFSAPSAPLARPFAG